MTDDTDTWHTDARTRLSVLSANLETLAALAAELASEAAHPRSREFDALATALREEALVIQDALQSATTAEQEETFEMALRNLVELREETPDRVLSAVDERAEGSLETFE
ncbi:hypothetical protein SAMN04487949_3592 [Halogranum gelatinilyticum]|uniref:Uncharacterized protein n=1 Tax=Halogranum gelatinilyticum TaxID=660521 RepID=A0A1G9ZB45_9EURY|nr:hypothetical protein [Halogranum gelatinilyticum]SDN18688.1 hypothetical protein SAMN04487949_3592 [Halogranum gelatinilyticum]